MHFANLGRTSLRVSRLCLSVSDDAAIQPALRLGINFFMTLEPYGPSEYGLGLAARRHATR